MINVKSLRMTLIIFGWLIPLVSVLSLFSSTYIALKFGDLGGQRARPLWGDMISNITYFIRTLTLSPLCFFGAFMLDKRGALSND